MTTTTTPRCERLTARTCPADLFDEVEAHVAHTYDNDALRLADDDESGWVATVSIDGEMYRVWVTDADARDIGIEE